VFRIKKREEMENKKHIMINANQKTRFPLAPSKGRNNGSWAKREFYGSLKIKREKRKEKSHGANKEGRGSFLGHKGFLTTVRRRQKDLSLNMAVGTGRGDKGSLWQGRDSSGGTWERKEDRT